MSSPDERALIQSIESANFRIGEIEDHWNLIKREGIILFISVRAKDKQDYIFRLDCSNYPQVPPTGGLWDSLTNDTLSANKWPTSKTERGIVKSVFRPDWHGGKSIYFPCDRLSMAAHPEWSIRYPSMTWRQSEGIVRYLEIIHEILNSNDYSAPIST